MGIPACRATDSRSMLVHLLRRSCIGGTMRAVGDGDAVTWRFEVQINGEPVWLPYDGRHIDGVGEYDDCAGKHVIDECWDDLAELAAHELTSGLGAITSDLVRFGALTGLRVCVWRTYDSTEGDPEVVLSASPKQLAAGRLFGATDDVAAALYRVEQARRRLRAQVVAASAEGHLDRAFIAKTAEPMLQDDVSALLTGYDLVTAVYDALPAAWSHTSPYPYDPAWDDEDEGYVPPLSEKLVFWCGRVRLSLAPTGEVTLSLSVCDYCVEGYHDMSDPDEVDKAAQADRRVRARRACAEAKVVWPMLRARGIEMYTREGGLVGAKELSATFEGSSLLVARPVTGRLLPHPTPILAEAARLAGAKPGLPSLS